MALVSAELGLMPRAELSLTQSLWPRLQKPLSSDSFSYVCTHQYFPLRIWSHFSVLLPLSACFPLVLKHCVNSGRHRSCQGSKPEHHQPGPFIPSLGTAVVNKEPLFDVLPTHVIRTGQSGPCHSVAAGSRACATLYPCGVLHTDFQILKLST